MDADTRPESGMCLHTWTVPAEYTEILLTDKVLFGAMRCNTSHLYQVHYTYAVFCNRENFTVYKNGYLSLYHSCSVLFMKGENKTCLTLLKKVSFILLTCAQIFSYYPLKTQFNSAKV